MKYFNDNNEEFDLTEFCYYSEGRCARIYTNNDIAFKIYILDCKYKMYLSKKMFRLLKEANICNIVKLIDYYHVDKKSILPMDAYSMEFVKGKDVDLINASREYISDILTQLEETNEKLTEKGILVFDAHCDNILFKENGVTIIDPDQFYVRKFLPKKIIYEENNKEMYNYIRSFIHNEMKQKNEYYKSLYIDPYIKKYGLKKGFMNSYKTDTIYESLIL